MSEATPEVSIVIPSRHEAENLRRLLEKIRAELEEVKTPVEVLVVDAGPAEETQPIAEAAGARYLLEETPGYGAAVLHGAGAARGKYVLTMDADCSHPARFVPDLLAARQNADLAIASRYVPGGSANQPRLRSLLSRVLNGFFRAYFRLPYRDLSSGYRLYRRDALLGLPLRHHNFVMLIEILLRARRRGWRIVEIPFAYAPRHTGSSNARILRFGWDYLRLFLHMRRLYRENGD